MNLEAVPLETCIRKILRIQQESSRWLLQNQTRHAETPFLWASSLELFHAPVITSLWTERQFVRHQNQ